MKEIQNLNLINAAKAGNEKAFTELYKKYKNIVMRQVFLKVGSGNLKSDIDDIVQEAFIKAFNKISSYEPTYEFSTWIVRIAVNNIIDHSRKEKNNNNMVSLSDYKTFDNSQESITYADMIKDDTDRTFEKTDTVTHLMRIMESMDVSDSVKMVVNMRVIEGYSYDQIAEKLDIPVGTVKSYIHRMKAEIAKQRCVKELLEA